MSSLLIFIIGLAVGSFLNVAICRLKTKEQILLNRSYCPKCRAVLKWFDLIPVLSFLIQKGKCRYCGQKISWQYPLVEIATGLLFLAVVLSNAKNLAVFYYLFIGCSLIVIFVYDFKHYLIPDKIVYPAIIIALVYQIFEKSLINSLVAAFLASGFFLFFVLISKGKWMGLGDVKLAFLMGLVLSWPNILLALFLAFFSGAMVGIGLIILGRKTIKSQVPFGPFLAGATVVVMLYGSYLAGWFQIIKIMH